MTEPPVTGWEVWAPPLDPPTSGGLSVTFAQQIADLSLWPINPHLTAALQWESYAATLEPTSAVSTLSTGAQSVGFDPAAVPGPYGAAVRQAQWHRSFLGDTYSVQLRSTSEDVVYDDSTIVVDTPTPVVMSRQAIRWGPGDSSSGG